MKAAIFTPYLDTFGGGEKYMLTIAEVLSSKYEIDVLLDKNLEGKGADYLKNTLSKRFNLNLTSVQFIRGPFGKGSSSISRMLFLKKYDILFYLTDGSIFYPTAKKNILHIQSPLAGQPSKGFWGKCKLKGWDLVIYNSYFTKNYAQNNWNINSDVIYPPVDTEVIKPLQKNKYILSVGRFFGYLKDKKHEVFIKAFEKLFKEDNINGWSLHLAGSAGEGDKGYIEYLKGISKKLPVNFYPNLDYDDLVRLYGEASIYWHAMGFGEVDPAKKEHFGIATVEAMAGGSVPVVINEGGQKEIVEHNVSGYLWNTIDELEDKTLNLLRDQSLRRQMAKQAQVQAEKFSKKIFIKKIQELM